MGQKIATLRELVRTQSSVRFSDMFAKAQSKGEMVATFLALLELIRMKEVVVRQDRLFDEIVIRPINLPPPQKGGEV